MNHSFNVEIAKKYGIEKAILLENFYFWIKKNKANKRNMHEGKVYTYNTAEAFAELFPYIKERKIAQILREMENEDGLLTSGQFHNYDRTKSYTLTDSALSFFEPSNIQNFDNGISENCIMDNQKNVSCLNTDINTDINKTDINTDKPFYIPDTPKNYNETLKIIHSLILSHNSKQTVIKKKIGIEKEFFYFIQKQKEGIAFLHLLQNVDSDIVIKALKNYLIVASSDSWLSGFSITAFCNKYLDYTDEFFDIKKYIDIPPYSEEESEEFLKKMYRKKLDWFSVYLFNKNKKDWWENGKPEGEAELKRLMQKWEKLDDEGGKN